MQADFEEPELFQARYQRNNKRGGLKNLRCFPTCASMHRERGFCGRMVVLMVRHSPNARLSVFGEFVPITEKQVATGLKVEDVVEFEKAKEICRDKLHPTKPWMEGEILETSETFTRFAFNRDKKGWHYGWASNKHTCNASHALQAYVMEQSGSDKLVVKGVFQSPQFTLFCRRRRRFAMVPSAPIAPPASKKRSRSERKAKDGTQTNKDVFDGDDDQLESDLSDNDEEDAFQDDDNSSIPFLRLDDEAPLPQINHNRVASEGSKKRKVIAKSGDSGGDKGNRRKNIKKTDDSTMQTGEKPLTKKRQYNKRHRPSNLSEVGPTDVENLSKKKRKRRMVVETELSSIGFKQKAVMMISAESLKKLNIARVEKMLREISKRTTTRTRPILLSRPCSPAELVGSSSQSSKTDSASSSSNSHQHVQSTAVGGGNEGDLSNAELAQQNCLVMSAAVMTRDASPPLLGTPTPAAAVECTHTANIGDADIDGRAGSTDATDDVLMSQEQFSTHLFECIDFFAGDSLLDDHIMFDREDEDGDDDDFLVRLSNDAHAGSQQGMSPTEKHLFVEELATYLLDAKGFTDAIYGLAKAAKAAATKMETTIIKTSLVGQDQDNLTDESAPFESFIGVLISHLSTFLQSRGMVLEDFDRVFPDEETFDANKPFQSGEDMLARSAFRQIMLDEETPGDLDEDDAHNIINKNPPSTQGGNSTDNETGDSSRRNESSTLLPLASVDSSDTNRSGSPLDQSLLTVQRMNGTWILSSSPAASAPSSPSSAFTSGVSIPPVEDGIESMRESLGYPWILRKMLNFMEEKFCVQLEGNVLAVRLQRRLFSSGAVTIVLDGEEHSWGMRLPMFEGIASAWKYRAWINDEGMVHHVHDTGGSMNSRMRRTMWVDESDCLRIDVKLEEFNVDAGRWDTVAHAVQKAVRCT